LRERPSSTGSLRARAWWRGVAAAATCAALPLLFARGASRGATAQGAASQESAPAGERKDAAARGARDDERVDAGPALSRFDGPTLAASLLLEDGARERSDPLLVAKRDGGAWLLCLEHEVATGDRLALRELRPDGTFARPDAPPLLLPAPPAPPVAIARPVAVVDGAGRLVVAWSELVDGVVQLRAARGGAGGFDESVTLTGGATPNRNPELACAADGTAWIAWERWGTPATAVGGRGSFDIALAPLRDGATGGLALGDALVVGDGPGSELDPVVVADGAGLAVAWVSWRGRDYEIALRRVDLAASTLGPVVEVSADAASDDLHPTLAAAADGALWLAWDRFEDEARGRSWPAEQDVEVGATRRAPATAALRVACVRGDAVTLPAARAADGSASVSGFAPGVPLLGMSGAAPRLVARRDGSLALLFRFLARQGAGGKAYGFPLLASTIDAAGIAPPTMVAGSAGAPDEPAGCIVGDGALLVAWQQDHRLEVETGTLLRPLANEPFQKLATHGVVVTGALGPSAVGVARLEAAADDAGARGPAVASTPRPARLAPPHAAPFGDDLSDPIVNGSDHVLIEAGEKRYRVYWGDLHRHSSASRCSRGFEPGPDDRWRLGRDVSLYDFMALTDHSCHVDPVGWWRLDKAGAMASDPEFVALQGFEWSTGFHGHQNVILRGGLRPFLSNVWKEASTLPGLYARLRPEWALAIPHHTADVARRTDFAECDPQLVRLVEIYQAQRGSYEFDGCLRQSALAHADGSFATDALAKGRRVGFIASTDHGEGCAYACVLAEKLERGALFDALRARRTYGATAKGMVIDLRVDDRLMGEELATSGAPRVTLHARGTRELCEAIVFRDGAPWQVIGRAPRAPAAATSASTTITLQLDLAPPKTARALDWRMTIAPAAGAGASAAAVAMKPWFELPGYAKDDLPPDRPQWRVKEGVATYLWRKSYASYWEPSHSRLRLTGPRDAAIKLEARAVGEGSREAGVAATAFARETTLAALLAEPLAGDGPLGAWRCSAKEAFDAAFDRTRTLGARELTQEWRDESLAPGDHWYYARIVQADGEIAWSSPLFVSKR